MKRWVFNLLAALSLLLSVAASAAWAMSYAGPSGWRLLAIAHSADLTPGNSARGTVLFTTPADWSKTPHYGFWDAWWGAQPVRATDRARTSHRLRRHTASSVRVATVVGGGSAGGGAFASGGIR